MSALVRRLVYRLNLARSRGDLIGTMGLEAQIMAALA